MDDDFNSKEEGDEEMPEDVEKMMLEDDLGAESEDFEGGFSY